MIVRIVKMTFAEDKVESFESMFNSIKHKVRSQSGCNRLELLQDQSSKNVFFTYSFWDSQADLDTYRNTELFKEIWKETKAKFSDKPEAWSVKQKTILD